MEPSTESTIVKPALRKLPEFIRSLRNFVKARPDLPAEQFWKQAYLFLDYYLRELVQHLLHGDVSQKINLISVIKPEYDKLDLLLGAAVCYKVFRLQRGDNRLLRFLNASADKLLDEKLDTLISSLSEQEKALLEDKAIKDKLAKDSSEN